MADKVKILQIRQAKFEERKKQRKNNFSPVEKVWFDNVLEESLTLDDFDKTINLKNIKSAKISLVQNANSHFFKPKNIDEVGFEKKDLGTPTFETLNIVDRRILKRPSQLPSDILFLRESSYLKEQKMKDLMLDKLNVDIKFKNNFNNYRLIEGASKNFDTKGFEVIDEDYNDEEFLTSPSDKNEIKDNIIQNLPKDVEKLIKKEDEKEKKQEENVEQGINWNEIDLDSFDENEDNIQVKRNEESIQFKHSKSEVAEKQNEENKESLLKDIEKLNVNIESLEDKVEAQQNIFEPEPPKEDDKVVDPVIEEKILSFEKKLEDIFYKEAKEEEQMQQEQEEIKFDQEKNNNENKHQKVSKKEKKIKNEEKNIISANQEEYQNTIEKSIPVVNNVDFTIADKTDDLERVIKNNENIKNSVFENNNPLLTQEKGASDTTVLVEKIVNNAKTIKNANLETSKFDDFEAWLNNSKQINKLSKIAKKEQKRMIKLQKGKK
ncbi:hypothetical protein [Spiroplasma tabanidicola]|uniref:Uncharacterized protein n=1 Tax=Spiroplasma tabanidicola TaxID=324079 RepID=A0A6I6C4Q4_9MOLU|nr:hypothetical protein [Spiroplasma tabanidicola]QGS51787.1 hypothetical protein STABA_v1c04240 [Spiroplasma tabanidicola]